MNKIACIQHPKYDGSTSPNLLCRACCKIYIAYIRQSNKDFTEVTFEETKDQPKVSTSSAGKLFGRKRQDTTQGKLP